MPGRDGIVRQRTGAAPAREATAGTLAALALSRLLEALLVEVDPADPTTYLATALALGAVATFASLVPARRATRVNPIEALRID